MFLLHCNSEDSSRRRSLRDRDVRDVEKGFHVPFQYRNFNCKISTLKLVLIVISLGTLITLFCSPTVYVADHPSPPHSRYHLFPNFSFSLFIAALIKKE